MNILSSFNNIKLFVLDVDGVLTDGSLLLLEHGEMCRTMNIKDGYALQLAIKKGYKILIISGGTSEAVKQRLQKLGITDVFMQVEDKTMVMQQFMQTHQLSKPEVLYMGDDIPDLKPMQEAGLSCCPADAANEILKVALYISPKNGGAGCVRDVIEKVLKLHNNWNEDGIDSIQSK